MKWDQLSKKEKNRIAYEWLQCEGYDDLGNEHDSPEEYYNATRRVSLASERELAILACERGEITGAN